MSDNSATDGTSSLPTNNQDAAIIAVVAVCTSLTTIFTAARLVARRSLGKFVIEDYLSIITWALFMGYNAAIILQMQAGLGHHKWTIPTSALPRFAQLTWGIQMAYCVVRWIAKATLVFQLQRIFCPHRIGKLYITCQTLIWLDFVFYFSTIMAVVFQCVPQERIWNPSIKTGSCINNTAQIIATGIGNIISDLTILIIPVWTIFRLSMNKRRKLETSAVFITGLLAVACSVTRLVFTFPPLYSQDNTYLFAAIGYWSVAEIASIILCTCFPLMPRFMGVLRNKERTKSFGASTNDYHMTPPGSTDRGRFVLQSKSGESQDEIIGTSHL